MKIKNILKRLGIGWFGMAVGVIWGLVSVPLVMFLAFANHGGSTAMGFPIEWVLITLPSLIPLILINILPLGEGLYYSSSFFVVIVPVLAVITGVLLMSPLTLFLMWVRRKLR